MPVPHGSTPRRAVILTALQVEYEAVRDHLNDLREDQHPRDTVYQVGRFGSGPEAWEVAIAEIGPGNANAAAEAERAIDHFDPEVVLFVGVAGGIKDVKLGDVVAATKVYGYASGKADREFLPRPSVSQSAHQLEQRARAVRREPAWRKRIKGGINGAAPTVFIEPIAAGEQVVASRRSATWNLLRQQYSDAVAVEMEGSGFLTTAHANHQVRALVVRGISDLVSNKKTADAAGWQKKASRHASAFAFEVLAKIPLPPGVGVVVGAAPQGTGRTRRLVAGQTSSLIPVTEVLTTNLLKVDQFGPRLFLAETNFRSRSQVWNALRDAGYPSTDEFVLTNKRILTFHDLSEYPWNTICDRGTIEDFDTSEWAFSDDEGMRNVFTQLLNETLASKLWPQVRFFRNLDIYAFSPKDGLEDIAIRYKSSKINANRTVFKAYPIEYKGKSYVHYRHQGFRGQFRLIDGSWFLEITPTYVFTLDGRRMHPDHEEKLKGIKRLDRHKAVLAQLLVLARYLSGQSQPASRSSLFLSFGELATVKLGVGIPDKLWQSSDESASADSGDDDVNSLVGDA